MDLGIPGFQLLGYIMKGILLCSPIFVIAIVIVLTKEFLRRRIEDSFRSPRSDSDFSGPEYRVRSALMTNSEAAFLYELRKQLPQDFYIFPKMRVADVLETQRGFGYERRRNKVLPKHVDFTICDRHFRPVVSIELNGKSHQSLRQQQSDSAKQYAFKSAGFPLEVVEVGAEFSKEIVQILNRHLS